MAELQKVLSYKVILLITINSIMGTGIFFLPAVGAAKAGPASIISWGILSLVAIYISMCFGELTSMFPKSGGVYEFCKQAYGRSFSFIIGWVTLIAGNVTIAMLVVGAIQYLLPYPIPWISIAASMLFIFGFNYIAYKGMKTSATMLVAFAFITVGTLLALIFPGLLKLQPGNFTPFFVMPASAILVAIFFISETFFGWETATFLAEETKDGEKVMPRALIWGTIIIAVICMLSVITSIGVIPWQTFGLSAAPLTDLAFFHFGSAGSYIFTILVYLSIIGSVAGWIVSAPRLILAMAKDRLFLSQFAAIHPKYFTPYKAIILQTAITTALVFIGAGSYQTLLQVLIPLVLFMYSAVLISVVILRYKMPEKTRHYTTPFGKIGPFVVVAFMAAMLIMWLIDTPGAGHLLQLAGAFILLGLPVYLLLELYYDTKFKVTINDALAKVALVTERFNLPKKVRRELIVLLGDLKNRTVLEYGCGVGTLTLLLADEVKPRGVVIATGESKHELEIVRRRLKKEGHSHVTVLHAKPNELHPKVPDIDIAVSVGMIGSIEQEEKILKDLNSKLAKNSKIVFLDYDKFFDVIPNIEWLSKDKKIKSVFRNAGFEVNVVRKQGFAWQYIYIFGKKVKNVK